MIRMVASFSLYHPTCSLATLTWNLPVSALAWASVQGQSVSPEMKDGIFSSSLSHARHLSRAHADEFCLNFSSSCQASAWSSVQTACTCLDENTPLDLQCRQRKSWSSAGDQSDTAINVCMNPFDAFQDSVTRVNELHFNAQSFMTVSDRSKLAPPRVFITSSPPGGRWS